MSEAQTMEQRRDQFAEGLFEKIIGTMEVATVYLGDRLGLYRALGGGEPATPQSSPSAPASTSATRASGSSSRRLWASWR